MLWQYFVRKIVDGKFVQILGEIVVEMILFAESGFVIYHLDGVVDTIVRQRKTEFGLQNKCSVLVVCLLAAVLGIAFLESKHFCSQIFTSSNEYNMFFLFSNIDAVGVVTEEQGRVQTATHFILLVVG